MDPKARAALALLIDTALAGPAGRTELDHARSALIEVSAAKRCDQAVAETTFRLFVEIAMWKSFGSLGAAISQSIRQAGILDDVARREATGFRHWYRGTRGRPALLALPTPQNA